MFLVFRYSSHEYVRYAQHLVGEVSASAPNSPGAPAHDPVARRTVKDTGRVNDRVGTGKTTSVHAARDRHRRDLPGRFPQRGPERVQRGASLAGLEGQQQAP